MKLIKIGRGKKLPANHKVEGFCEKQGCEFDVPVAELERDAGTCHLENQQSDDPSKNTDDAQCVGEEEHSGEMGAVARLSCNAEKPQEVEVSGITETSASSILSAENPTDVDKQRMDIVESDSANNVADRLAHLDEVMRLLYEKLPIMERVSETLERQIQSNKKAEQSMRSNVITQLVRRVIGWHDKLHWLVAEFRSRRLDTEHDVEMTNLLLGELFKFGELMLEFLREHGVSQIVPKMGDAVDYDVHECVKHCETANRAQDGTIAECIEFGYRYQDTGVVLKCAKVWVYQFAQEERN